MQESMQRRENGETDRLTETEADTRKQTGTETDRLTMKHRQTDRRTDRQTTRQGQTSIPGLVYWLVSCLTSQQHASVSLGLICSDKCTCCHADTEVADQTCYIAQSQYTDTGPNSPSADPIIQDAWQGSHWSTNHKSLV